MRKVVPRRWAPPEVLKPRILRTLEAAGELDADEGTPGVWRLVPGRQG